MYKCCCDACFRGSRALAIHRTIACVCELLEVQVVLLLLAASLWLILRVARLGLQIRLGHVLRVQFVGDFRCERRRNLTSIQFAEVQHTEEVRVLDVLRTVGTAAQAVVLVDTQQAANAVARFR